MLCVLTVCTGDLAIDAFVSPGLPPDITNRMVWLRFAMAQLPFYPLQQAMAEKLLVSKSVAGFTREEEIDFGTINDIRFLLEESLTRSAACFDKLQPWQEFVVVDTSVVTWQNPASTRLVGKTMVELLS